MAPQYTNYPIRTSTGTAQVKTAVDPTNPSNSPSIVDRNNNILFQWSTTNKKWEPLGSYSDTLPSNSGFSSTETYGSLLNQNNDVFTQNTTRVINKLPQNQKDAIRNSNSYSPYNTFVGRSQSTPQPDQQGSTAPTPPAAPTLPTPEEAASTASSPFGQYDPAPKFAPGQGLRYPKDIRDDQDRVQFVAMQITSRTGQQGGTGSFDFSFGSPVYTKVDNPVAIAIQAGISDQSSVDWGPDSVNAIDAALYNQSVGMITGGEEKLNNEIKGFFSGLYGELSKNQPRIQRYLAGQAANINNVLARTDGVVLNPNLELLFSGPQLRPFNFQFKMSARNDKEGQDIKKIINYFKYHMAVRTEDGLFIKAPHVFQIDYYNGNKLHDGINKISNGSNSKACALTNFSVDYTPLGSYMKYHDGTMVSYTLSMQFQEITPIYDTDLEPFKSSTSIGF